MHGLPESRRGKVGMYVFLFAAIVPGMIVAGFMPDWNVLPFYYWAAIAGCGGFVGGYLWDDAHPSHWSFSRSAFGRLCYSGARRLCCASPEPELHLLFP